MIHHKGITGLNFSETVKETYDYLSDLDKLTDQEENLKSIYPFKNILDRPKHATVDRDTRYGTIYTDNKKIYNLSFDKWQAKLNILK